MMASWERGRPARTKPGPASPISPTWINRERRHAPPSAWPMRFLPTGWLPAASHSSSAATKGTGCGRDARAPRAITPPLRGSRRSRAARRRLMRWGVDAGRLLRKPPCTLWETPVCRQAGPPPHDGPDHSRVKQVLFQRQKLLHFCPVGVTMSSEEPWRASRPHKSFAASAISEEAHPGAPSTGHLLHRNQPAAAASASAGPMRFPPAGRSAATSQGAATEGPSRGCRPDGESTRGCRIIRTGPFGKSLTGRIIRE